MKGSFPKGHVSSRTYTLWPSWACIKDGVLVLNRYNHYINSFTLLLSLATPYQTRFDSIRSAQQEREQRDFTRETSPDNSPEFLQGNEKDDESQHIFHERHGRFHHRRSGERHHPWKPVRGVRRFMVQGVVRRALRDIHH